MKYIKAMTPTLAVNLGGVSYEANTLVLITENNGLDALWIDIVENKKRGSACVNFTLDDDSVIVCSSTNISDYTKYINDSANFYKAGHTERLANTSSGGGSGLVYQFGRQWNVGIVSGMSLPSSGSYANDSTSTDPNAHAMSMSTGTISTVGFNMVSNSNTTFDLFVRINNILTKIGAVNIQGSKKKVIFENLGIAINKGDSFDFVIKNNTSWSNIKGVSLTALIS